LYSGRTGGEESRKEFWFTGGQEIGSAPVFLQESRRSGGAVSYRRARDQEALGFLQEGRRAEDKEVSLRERAKLDVIFISAYR
jgi:hypothetical protein